MRIIAGEFRGRRLLDPADSATRPITDRVKQSIFDILSDRLADVPVWDVFAGTGSFGLESLSREASEAVFFERHRPAVVRLRKNIEALGVSGRSRVVTQDIFRLSEADLAPLPVPGVVFFDPPYPFVRDRPADVRQALQRMAGRLTPAGLVVFRRQKGTPFEPGLPVLDDRTWGSMHVLFLGAAEGQRR